MRRILLVVLLAMGCTGCVDIDVKDSDNNESMLDTVGEITVAAAEAD
jgi:hypothetical protein